MPSRPAADEYPRLQRPLPGPHHQGYEEPHGAGYPHQQLAHCRWPRSRFIGPQSRYPPPRRVCGANEDGHPNDGIPATASRVYTYPNKQLGATLWYHDHTHGITGERVYRGLAGLYLLNDSRHAALRLPRGIYEVPLVIQDRTFDASGQFVYNLDDMAKEMGVTGDLVLVNGKVNPFFEVAARKYRFRILNGSNSRQYLLKLDNGNPLVQIRTDGGLLHRQQYKTQINIAPAERIDIIIDFTGIPLGTNIILKNVGGEGRTGDIMQFKVTKPRGKENANS
ncbi:MAG: multicopper oxidase domain-containing protein [Pseudomonas sp.]